MGAAPPPFMRSTMLMAVLGVSLMSSACATKSQTGAATGAAGGAIVGGVIGGTEGAIIGGLLGGALGWGVGRQMEIEDQRRFEAALEHNRRMEWYNAQTGHHYEVAPTNSYRRNDGRQCRQFRMVTDVDGRPDEVRGVACRGPDGVWDLQG